MSSFPCEGQSPGGWGRLWVELFLSDGWNSCLYNIPKIAYIVFSTFLGEYAAYVLKYWESFISTINLRKNEDTFYFSCRWEIPDNQVLLTKSWQQAAAHFSRNGDNGGKMAQAVSYFFLLIPLPIKPTGLGEIKFMDKNASPTLAKKKWFITLNHLALPKHRHFYYSRTTKLLCFLFSLPV